MSDDNDEYFCEGCQSTLIWLDCESCGGEGVAGHNCGEDCCCCVDPEDNMTCDLCNGNGGHWDCSCADTRPTDTPAH